MTSTASLSRSSLPVSAPDRAKALSQFYTKPDLAADCIRQVRAHLGDQTVDLWIEPSAGKGAFLHQLPEPRIGIDIDPRGSDIEPADFLSWKPLARSSDGLVVVIGNPPFGKNASDAVRFFNKAASFADVIAFILPRTFEKRSVQRRLDRHFHLKTETVLTDAVFIHKGVDVRLSVVLQVWQRENGLRVDVVEPTEHPDFAFMTDREMADIALQRVGAAAGRVRTSFADRSPSSNYFIQFRTSDRPVADILRSIDFTEVKARCAGNPSIAKTEIIRLYREQLAVWAGHALLSGPATEAEVAAAPTKLDLGPDAAEAADRTIATVQARPDGGAERLILHDVMRSAGLRRSRIGTGCIRNNRRRRELGAADRPVLRAHGRPPTASSQSGDRGRKAHGRPSGGPPRPPAPAYPVDLTRVVISNGDVLRGNWVEGHLRSDPSYCFEAEVYPMGSRFGIDGGRISMLRLRFIGTRPSDTEEVWYERGWEGEPPERHRAAIAELCRAFPEPTEAQHGAHLAAQVRAEIEHQSRDQGSAEHVWGSRR